MSHGDSWMKSPRARGERAPRSAQKALNPACRSAWARRYSAEVVPAGAVVLRVAGEDGRDRGVLELQRVARGDARPWRAGVGDRGEGDHVVLDDHVGLQLGEDLAQAFVGVSRAVAEGAEGGLDELAELLDGRLAEDGRRIADEVLPELTGRFLGRGRRAEAHVALLEALRLEGAGERLLDHEDDAVAAFPQDLADPHAVVGRAECALREEHDRRRHRPCSAANSHLCSHRSRRQIDPDTGPVGNNIGDGQRLRDDVGEWEAPASVPLGMVPVRPEDPLDCLNAGAAVRVPILVRWPAELLIKQISRAQKAGGGDGMSHVAGQESKLVERPYHLLGIAVVQDEGQAFAPERGRASGVAVAERDARQDVQAVGGCPGEPGFALVLEREFGEFRCASVISFFECALWRGC